jgi:hypothetical protein
MQERDGLRALKREIKMSREGKVKKNMCMEKKRKEKKEKREKKRKEEEWQERYEVDESSER